MITIPPAMAVPSDEDIAAVNEQAGDTRSQIATLEVELATNSADLDRATIAAQIAAEAFNEATVELEEAEAAADAAQEELEEANAERDEARGAVAAIAMSAYRNGGNFSQLSLFLQADGITEAINSANSFSVLGTSADSALQRMEAAEIVAEHAQDAADEAVADQRAATESLADANDDAAAAAAAAESAVTSTQARRDELITQLADLRNTSVEMERERQDQLDADRRARDNAAAQAVVEDAAAEEAPAQAERPQAPDRPSASTEPSSPSDGDAADRPVPPAPSRPAERPTPPPATTAPTPDPAPTQAPAPKPEPKPEPKPQPKPDPKPPAPSGAGQIALDWAKTQIGKPYVYGAAGPNSYDCSGLTLQAFKRAGINLPRRSAAQYNVGTHVPVGQMKPGDLFFYSNNGAASGIYHVAIYAGNGMRLHAPSPGKTVELVPMWWPNVLPQAVRF